MAFGKLNDQETVIQMAAGGDLHCLSTFSSYKCELVVQIVMNIQLSLTIL